MRFSEKFSVSEETIRAYGAVDISLICDMPLFIDPMLIFNSTKPEYKKIHKSIIKYFFFLKTKSQNNLSDGEIDAWFGFHEVVNNWFGYSLSGNKGLALGKEYSQFLYQNINFILNDNGITQSQHIEKSMLLYKGSGKDKISDLTVNLIKYFLLQYTSKFAHNYIDSELCKTFPVEKAFFNYETESFVSEEYTLPYITNSKGDFEYILLTPYDILREGEPSINKKHYIESHERIRASINNNSLRAYVNNYISLAVKKYEEAQRAKSKSSNQKTISSIEKNAFMQVTLERPILYDYYIKLRENDDEEIKRCCLEEFNTQVEKFTINSKQLISKANQVGYTIDESLLPREEAKQRIIFFKHIIEDCDGYKNLYVNGKKIANENDLQRLFKFVWFGTKYKVNYEADNGRGKADVIVSMGQDNQNIIEFKLASNSRLSHVFEQVKIYEKANESTDSLIVIFYFTESEYSKTSKMIKNAGYETSIDDSIFLVDCRSDNKPSASTV